MVFVDTWAWLALAYAKDPYQAAAAQQHREFRRQKTRYVTTDHVLAEFLSALFRVVPFASARQFADGLFESFTEGRHRLVFLSPEQFQRAYQLRLKYHDKPGISFVDITSMVVMQDLAITDVFTGDAHFEQVGLGFRVVP
jgi:predicted nucleic acid-binding protein